MEASVDLEDLLVDVARDQITKRREAYRALFDKLDDRAVLERIDRDTDAVLHTPESGHSAGDVHSRVTWRSLLDAVMQGMRKDGEAYVKNSKGKDGRSKTPAQAVGADLRRALKIADGRGPRLHGCIVEVVRHIRTQIGNPTIFDGFILNYTGALVDSVLCVPAYVSLFERQAFDEILKLYFELAIPGPNPPLAVQGPNIRVLAARAVYMCMSCGSAAIVRAEAEMCFHFFANFRVPEAAAEQTVGAYLLGACNAFLREVVADFATEARSLFATLSPSIFSEAWATRNAHLKEEIHQFFRVCLRARLAESEAQHRLVIESLYERIVSDLQPRSVNYGRGARPVIGQERIKMDYATRCFLDLAADVFWEWHLLCVPAADESGERDGGKLRRRVTVFDDMCDRIESSVLDRSSVHWAQVFAAAIDQHPALLATSGDINSARGAPSSATDRNVERNALRAIRAVLPFFEQGGDSLKMEHWLCRCASVVLVAMRGQSGHCKAFGADFAALLALVWAHVLRRAGARVLPDGCYRFLTDCVTMGFISADVHKSLRGEIFVALKTTVSRPTRCGMEFALALLSDATAWPSFERGEHAQELIGACVGSSGGFWSLRESVDEAGTWTLSYLAALVLAACCGRGVSASSFPLLRGSVVSLDGPCLNDRQEFIESSLSDLATLRDLASMLSTKTATMDAIVMDGDNSERLFAFCVDLLARRCEHLRHGGTREGAPDTPGQFAEASLVTVAVTSKFLYALGTTELPTVCDGLVTSLSALLAVLATTVQALAMTAPSRAARSIDDSIDILCIRNEPPFYPVRRDAAPLRIAWKANEGFRAFVARLFASHPVAPPDDEMSDAANPWEGNALVRFAGSAVACFTQSSPGHASSGSSDGRGNDVTMTVSEADADGQLSGEVGGHALAVSLTAADAPLLATVRFLVRAQEALKAAGVDVPEFVDDVLLSDFVLLPPERQLVAPHMLFEGAAGLAFSRFKWQRDAEIVMTALYHATSGHTLDLHSDGMRRTASFIFSVAIENLLAGCKATGEDMSVMRCEFLLKQMSGASTSATAPGGSSRRAAKSDDAEYPPEARIFVAESVLRAIMTDEELRWKVEPVWPSEGTAVAKRADLLAAFVFDESFLVRSRVCAIVGELYAAAARRACYRDVALAVYDKVVERVRARVQFNIRTQREGESDRQRGRPAQSLTSPVSDCLHFAVAVQHLLPRERDALFRILRSASSASPTVIGTLESILNVTATALGYSCGKELVVDSMPYILSKWVQEGLSVRNFPARILGISFEAFLTEFESEITAQTVLTGKSTLIGKLASDTSGARHDTLLRCSMWKVLAYYHPLRLAEPSRALEVHECIVQYLGQAEVDRHMRDNVARIVAEMIFLVDDVANAAPDKADKWVSEPNPPTYSSGVLNAAFAEMCRLQPGDKDVLGRLLPRPSQLALLLNISLRISLCRRDADALRFLRVFVYFTLATCTSLESPAILRECIQCGVRNLVRPLLRGDCCRLLRKVCALAIKTNTEALAEHVPLIVWAMVRTIDSVSGDDKESCTVRESARKVLETLIMNMPELSRKSKYMVCLSRLEPLPEGNPAYADVRDRALSLRREMTIRDELEQFLDSGQQLASTFRVPALEHLRVLLRERKKEFVTLLRTEVTSNVTPHGVRDLLVRVVGELSLLCGDSHPEDVRILAAECLGELGPADVRAVAFADASRGRRGLQVEVDSFRLEPDKLLVQRNKELLVQLNTLMSDADVACIDTAASCLKEVLKTPKGKAAYEDADDRLKGFLVLFLSSDTEKTRQRSVDETRLSYSAIRDGSLWVVGDMTHSAWLTRLTAALIESSVGDEFLRRLLPLCRQNASFCERVFSYAVHSVLSDDVDGTRRTALSLHFNGFLRSATARRATCSVRTIINVILYLRTQPRPGMGTTAHSATAWPNNFWLDLDFGAAAEAAQASHGYFTSILLLEIWHLADAARAEQTGELPRRRSFRRSVSMSGQSASLYSGGSSTMDPYGSEAMVVDSAPAELPDNSAVVNRLLLGAYSRINEPDGLYGVERGVDSMSLIRTYEHAGNWVRAMETHGMMLAHGHVHDPSGLLDAMRHAGYSHMHEMYLRACTALGSSILSARNVDEQRYEAAWRCMNWSGVDEVVNGARATEAQGILAKLRSVGSLDGGPASSSPSFHRSVYGLLSSLGQKDGADAEGRIRALVLSLARDVSTASLESVRTVNDLLVRLESAVELSEIVSVDRAVHMSQTPTDELGISLGVVNDRWWDRRSMIGDHFECAEPILSLRGSALRVLGGGSASAPLQTELLAANLTELARAARRSGRHVAALDAVAHLRKLAGSGSISSVASWAIEEAKSFWALGETDAAYTLVRDLIMKMWNAQSRGRDTTALHVRTLTLCAKWAAELRRDFPDFIVEEFLQPAITLAKDCDADASGRAHFAMARFADAQYQSLTDGQRSPFAATARNIQKSVAQELSRYQKMKRDGAGGRDVDRHIDQLERFLQSDQEQRVRWESERKEYLMRAINNYVSGLASTDKHDGLVFRLCGLWLEWCDTYNPVNDAMRECIKSVPSHKFLPLMYQLGARMSRSRRNVRDEKFQPVLFGLIRRAVIDHPHHALPVVMALKNALKGVLAKNKSVKATEDRAEAAAEIVAEASASMSALVKQMESLCDAYIHAANIELKVDKGAALPPQDFDRNAEIVKLKDLDHVAVVTADIRVSPSKDYRDIVTVKQFKRRFTLAGGVNLPKIVQCLGSDGRFYTQLVKGKDDMRQDAVMQQVFGMVNTLLDRSEPTRARRLRVRTYKIVPMSQLSGVLEFVSNTLPVGTYLSSGVSPLLGAHRRYRAKDWEPARCSQTLKEGQELRKKGQRGAALEAYLRIVANYKPVFRHFFFERFPDPAEWFERRLAYTRSAAASSIVGYALGLGDRHVQNILIDTKTAELVHIDLGIAFEQGKALLTPELVPFRLTPDIVDGMGIAGVEGPFRRCCERTLEVLRTNHDALVTIIEVFLHDPLFKWNLTVTRAARIQGASDDSEQNDDDGGDVADPFEARSKLTDRVLVRLRQKLQGYEEGAQMTVSGQVNVVIQEAQDPENLSRMYVGWQPWL